MLFISDECNQIYLFMSDNWYCKYVIKVLISQGKVRIVVHKVQ